MGSNVDANLTARGIAAQPKVKQIQDFDGSLGGPIKRDKLWFLISARKQLTHQQSPLCKNADGSPCVDRSYVNSGHLRLTYQLNPKNKFSAMWIRNFKKSAGEAVTFTVNGVPATIGASTQRLLDMFYVTQQKWTATPNPKLLIEVGFSLDKLDYDVVYQNGKTEVPFSPAWYSQVLVQDTARNLRYNVGPIQNFFKFDRYVVQAKGAYVTGAHQIRFGVQDSWGPAYQKSIMNGDLYAIEVDGAPRSVTVFNTPFDSKPYLRADLGLYATDTWTWKRLTITPGIRWEYLSNKINPSSAPAGRFVPARNFAAVTCDTYKGISCFKNWAPRFGLVYDLFGNHKTALKIGAGKYNTPLVQNNLNLFNPMSVQSQSRSWINTGGCNGSACFPTDDQIGPAPSTGFGTLTPRSVDPNYHREYNMQYSVGVQHQLRNGLMLNFNWVRRDDYQQTLIVNRAVPSSAWTPVTISNPLDGTPITFYNLDKSYVGLTPQLYQTNAPRSLRANSYNGFETSIRGRLPHGAFILAGWTVDREHSRQCDQTVGPNSLNDPNSLRYCDWYGNMHQNLGAVGSLPYRNEFKLQGNVPLWFKFEFSGSLYSAPAFNANFSLNNLAGSGNFFPAEPVFAGAQQGFKEVYWQLTSTTRYPANCICSTPGAVVNAGLTQGSETIMLVAPGSRLTPQLTQVDIGIRRAFIFHDRYSVKTEAQIFNLINSNVVTTEAQTLGSNVTPFVKGGIGGVPTAILNPRMLRLSMQFQF
ncbi:MAG: TonB-dependent receptor [Acidobacteriota bacterium]